MKHAILTDFQAPSDWIFRNEISKSSNTEWEVKCCTSNTKFHHTKIGKLIRYFLYFFFPLRIILIRKRYRYILGWQQFYAINLAFWSKLLHLKKTNKIIVMTFIYKRKSGWMGNLYHHYMQFSLTGGYISNIICHSKSEIEYYTNLFKLPNGIVQFIPLGIENSNTNERIDCDTPPYIFTTGRSNRDYPFLISSLSHTGFLLKIACEENLEANTNIEIKKNCYGNEMLNLLRKCYCVCIPLKEANISSGQLVILQAMQYGKPIIVTRTDSIVDYIIEGYNGFIINNTKDELTNKLTLLYNNPSIYQYMSKNCLSHFKNNFTLSQMAQNISKTLISSKIE